MNFPKRCGCGRVYLHRAAWNALPLCGHQVDYWDGYALELRNCPCRSTIAIARFVSWRLALAVAALVLVSGVSAWVMDRPVHTALHAAGGSALAFPRGGK